MKSSALHIVPVIHAELDLSSVCAVTLMRGLDLLRSGNYPVDLDRIARGNHRLLPYALEFWIEHCLLYTSNGGTLDEGCQLTHHLTRLHDTHGNLSKSLNWLKDELEPVEASDSQTKDRLKPFAHIPAYAMMEEVFRIRRLAIQGGYENGKGMCTTYLSPNFPHDNHKLTNVSFQMSRHSQSRPIELFSAG